MPVIAAPSTPTHELPGTQFTSLATPSRGSTHTSVWLVEIAPGTLATPHELTCEEVFVVLRGRAAVRLGDERYEVEPGDAIVVPATTTFELTAAGDAVFAALCCMPVGGRARVGDGEPFTPPWAL